MANLVQTFGIRQWIRDVPVSALLEELEENSPCWQELDDFQKQVVKKTLQNCQRILLNPSSDFEKILEAPLIRMGHSVKCPDERTTSFFKERCYIHLNKRQDPAIKWGESGIKFALALSLTEQGLTLEKVVRSSCPIFQAISQYANILKKILEFKPDHVVHIHFNDVNRSKKGKEKLHTFMDFYPKKDLQTNFFLIAQMGEGRKRRLIRQILEGVRNLHALQIVHGNLHFSNILLDKTENAFIGDFKRSVFTGEVRSHSPDFAAPELSSSPCAQPSDDLWSVGIVISHILLASDERTWEKPPKLEEPKKWALFLKERIAILHPSMLPLIEGLLEKRPKKRLSAEEALGLLEKNGGESR